ncbi:MAG: hypothetical protein JXL97_12645 [Bacteroidales bacterium]|nr:hypothetical protein [Bacteroidales bacterium]
MNNDYALKKKKIRKSIKLQMQNKVVFIFFLSILFLISSCLTIDYKKYVFEINSNNSGTITILYANICNTNDSSLQQMTDIEAYEELVSDVFLSDIIRGESEETNLKSKRLFEKDGQLWGEIVLEFDSLSQIGFFQYNKKSPYMFEISNIYEYDSLISTNGKIVIMNPVENQGHIVFWDKKTKKMELTVKSLFANDATSSSLLPLWLERQ